MHHRIKRWALSENMDIPFPIITPQQRTFSTLMCTIPLYGKLTFSGSWLLSPVWDIGELLGLDGITWPILSAHFQMPSANLPGQISTWSVKHHQHSNFFFNCDQTETPMVNHNSQGQGHEHSENWRPNRMPNVYSVCLCCENRIFSPIEYFTMSRPILKSRQNIILLPQLWPITLKVNHNREFLVPMCMASWRKIPPGLFELSRSHHLIWQPVFSFASNTEEKMISIRNIYPMTLFGQPNIVLYKRKY